MKKRHARLVRLLAAAEHLKRMQEYRVRELDNAYHQLQERQKTLLEAFGGETCRSADLARMLRRNLDMAAKEARRTETEKNANAQILRERRMQMKQIERFAGEARKNLRHEKEKDALLDTLEMALRKR
jgi:hypothetical protein